MELEERLVTPVSLERMEYLGNLGKEVHLENLGHKVCLVHLV